MIEIVGNVWTYWERGHFVGITTNGVVKKDGRLVMGKGLALEARERFKCTCDRDGCTTVDLDLWLGRIVQQFGNQPHFVRSDRLFTFPTKHHWRDKSSLSLIRTSANLLMEALNNPGVGAWLNAKPLILPRPGCANGGLDWRDVGPELAAILDDRVHVICTPAEVGL